ncbi:MAG: Hsp20/alpha crystallin family protein [Syntrophomonadaceae bacterium]|nr:Hsp20/alpha crystallin family protein [Syntrophomonadaceae bacterium]
MRRFLKPVNDYPLKLWKAGIERFQDEMDRWFEEASKFGLSMFPSDWGFKTPKVEVYDADTKLVVSVELPGVEKADLDVRVYPNYVAVKAEKKQQTEVKEENYYHSERYYGSIARNIPLPVEVNPDGAEAQFKNGVLKLDLPKKEMTPPGKRIELK